MSYTFRKNLVSPGKYNKKCPHTLNASSITVHNTANDASADKEIRYMISNSSPTSFHYAVDDKEIVQGIPENRNAWHCGNTKGNRNSLSVEICYSKSGGPRFIQAEQNAAQFVAGLLKQRGWGIDRVRTHKSWSGKYCPHRTLDMGWGRFLNMVQSYMNGETVFPTPAPAPTPGPSGSSTGFLSVDGYWGKDTTRAVQRMFNTDVDGIVSRQYSGNKKYLKNATGGWEFLSKGYQKGSWMIKELQKLVGVIPDGIAGKNTVIALQHRLNVLGYGPLTEDGYMGKNTVKAWQRFLNKWKKMNNQ